jgi:hypothetical protein
MREPQVQGVGPWLDRSEREQCPEHTDTEERAGASMQRGIITGGVRSDGRLGTRARRRSLEETARLKVLRGYRLSSRPLPVSTDGFEPEKGPERTLRGPRIGARTRGPG